MSGDITLKVEGLKEIERALLELGGAVSAKVMGKALRPPMAKVADAARAKVHKRSGELHDAIDLTPVARATARRASMADTLSEVGIRIKKTSTKGGPKLGTGGGETKMRPRSYWHLEEFGTAHSPAHPYLRPAWDENQSGLAEEPRTIMSAEIERIRARFAAKTRRRRGRG